MHTRFSPIALLIAAACGPPVPPEYPVERAAEPVRSAAAIEGEVLGVDRVAPADKLASGVELRISPGARDQVVVDLAPDWYLDRHGLSFAPSERVRVEGARVQQKRGTVIYATRVEKGGKTVELREAGSGKPLWQK